MTDLLFVGYALLALFAWIGFGFCIAVAAGMLLRDKETGMVRDEYRR